MSLEGYTPKKKIILKKPQWPFGMTVLTVSRPLLGHRKRLLWRTNQHKGKTQMARAWMTVVGILLYYVFDFPGSQRGKKDTALKITPCTERTYLAYPSKLHLSTK